MACCKRCKPTPARLVEIQPSAEPGNGDREQKPVVTWWAVGKKVKLDKEPFTAETKTAVAILWGRGPPGLESIERATATKCNSSEVGLRIRWFGGLREAGGIIRPAGGLRWRVCLPSQPGAGADPADEDGPQGPPALPEGNQTDISRLALAERRLKSNSGAL